MALKIVRESFKVVERRLKIVGVRKLSGDSESVLKSGFPDVEIPDQTLPEFFEPYFEKFRKFTAIECCETKRKYTYGEIKDKGQNIAKAFIKILNLKNGDVVAVVLPNIPEYPIVSYSILKANLIITTVSPAFTSDEIFRQLRDSQSKVVITDFQNYTKVNQSVQKLGKNLPVVMVKTRNGQQLPNGAIDFHEIMNTEMEQRDVKPWRSDNIAILPYSSGTTGLPKGVQLTHKNLVSNLFQQNQPQVRYLVEASEDFQEIFPSTLPFYHAFGFNVLMNGSVLYGGKVVTLEKFTPDSYTTMLKEYRSTCLFTVPPIVLLLTNRESIRKEYLGNLRTLISGAAPLSESDEHRFHQKFGDHIHLGQGYGLTETTAITSFSYPNVTKGNAKSRGCVGIPIINTTIKVMSIEDSQCLPFGPMKTGEIYVKGPQVMKGYFKCQKETENSLTEDGWLKTGDIGYYNEDGFLFITDRIKELIKVKGNQVAPAELESLIRSFPGVAEAAVVGVPHANSGEVPRAYVVAKKGKTVDVKNLYEFVSGRVAKYKKLEGGVVVVDEIPKSPSGKILRKQLKQEFKDCGR